MPFQDPLDRLSTASAATFHIEQGSSSAASRSYARQRRRIRRHGRSVSLLGANQSDASAPASQGDVTPTSALGDGTVDNNLNFSPSLRKDLERVYIERLPGARIIIARPPSVRYRETERAPLIQPAEFISQSRDGRSIMGVLQRTEDVDFKFNIPFISEPWRRCSPRSVDELRCLLSYNPVSDACEFFCCSHDVVIIGESSSRSHIVTRETVQIIEPGMWTVAIPLNANSRRHGFSRPRPLVEFLLMKRKFSVDVTQTEQTNGGQRAAAESRQMDVMDMSSTNGAVDANVTEFFMAPVVDEKDGKVVAAPGRQSRPSQSGVDQLPTIAEESAPVPESGPFYGLQDGETARVTTSPAGSSHPDIEQRYASTARPYEVTRLRRIDRNSNASVFACKHSRVPHMTLVAKALNVIPKNRHSIQSLAGHWRSEMNFLKDLNHKNIVKIFDWDARFYTVYLEYLPESLAPYPHERTFSRADATRILYDVASALAYLETCRISHNDIKPSNIAYSPARGAVVLDFGLATAGDRVPTRAGGTAWYVAPEAVQRDRRAVSNVWALGVTMLYVLGKMQVPEGFSGPWDFTNLADPESEDRAAMENWVGLVLDTAEEKLDRDDTVEFVVSGMLEQDPEDRLRAREIVEDLQGVVAAL